VASGNGCRECSHWYYWLTSNRHSSQIGWIRWSDWNESMARWSSARVFVAPVSVCSQSLSFVALVLASPPSRRLSLPQY